MGAAKHALLIEEARFELERTWSALHLGLVLMLLILGAPLAATPARVQESAFEVALASVGASKQLILTIIVVLTFAASFGRDIEQDILMGELTLPVGKEAIFAVKLAANYLVILLLDFVYTLFSTWITTASVAFTPVAAVVLADAASLLLIVSVTILASIILKSRLGAVAVAVAVYFLESVILLGISVMISSVNPPNLDPVYILLRLILEGEVPAYAWGVVLVHLLLPLALLLSALLYMGRVMQLD